MTFTTRPPLHSGINQHFHAGAHMPLPIAIILFFLAALSPIGVWSADLEIYSSRNGQPPIFFAEVNSEDSGRITLHNNRSSGFVYIAGVSISSPFQITYDFPNAIPTVLSKPGDFLGFNLIFIPREIGRYRQDITIAYMLCSVCGYQYITFPVIGSGGPDDDQDSYPNILDNCPLTANPDQLDMDRDGKGDACDEDIDGDGAPNGTDNCSLIANPDQLDTDHDGKGDACDNCKSVSNPNQADTDRDGIGDACDNCRLTVNRTQADVDKDGVGDACDNCRLVSNPDQADTDRDGIADACDNCKLAANATQTDTDKDGFGDICDTCPQIADPGQENNDGDAFGNACDPDDDNDLVPDINDNCRLVSNPTQADNDRDGFGDACDLDWFPAVLGIILD